LRRLKATARNTRDADGAFLTPLPHAKALIYPPANRRFLHLHAAKNCPVIARLILSRVALIPL